jgi:hypothetical protein
MGAAPLLELWGGIECSVVRIGDDYRNQLIDTGHASRFDDLEAMAELGIKAVRYPILWETVAPQTPGELDFSWHDKRLEYLRDRGIRVIAGLVHHGSGPKYTPICWRISPAAWHNAIRGSRRGTRSTSRSRPRAFHACTAIGTRTGPTSTPPSARWSTNASRSSARWSRSGR